MGVSRKLRGTFLGVPIISTVYECLFLYKMLSQLPKRSSSPPQNTNTWPGNIRRAWRLAVPLRIYAPPPRCKTSQYQTFPISHNMPPWEYLILRRGEVKGDDYTKLAGSQFGIVIVIGLYILGCHALSQGYGFEIPWSLDLHSDSKKTDTPRLRKSYHNPYALLILILKP